MPKCLPKGRTGKGSPTQASLYPKYCVKYIHQTANSSDSQLLVERHGSGVALRTLDYENPGSNPGCGLLQFTQLLIAAYGWMLPREADMVSE